VTDIPYIRTHSGWVFGGCMDLYSRKIVGWSMAPNMSASLMCTALHIHFASGNRQKDSSCILILAVNMQAMNIGTYWINTTWSTAFKIGLSVA